MRTLAAVLSALSLAAAVAASSAAAAAPGEGSFATAPAEVPARWTPARRAAAEPLSVLAAPAGAALDGAPLLAASGASTAGSTIPASSATTTAASPAATSTAAVEGVDTGDSTEFPNRANGTVYGEYVVAGKPTEHYQCSGSVIDSPAGDVVLTAGHCVIDPEAGAVARNVIFVPGYREAVAPFGVFTASSWVTTPEWESTAGTSRPDEGGDLAMLVLTKNANTGASVEATVGSFAIAFEGAREGTYTQWGYPGEAPYDGEVLYSNTQPYGGLDLGYSPPPLRIASDFTAGASGGPWTVGPASAPTVLSLTDYYYPTDPRHLYGAYFGEAAREVYENASGVVVPPVTTGAAEASVPTDATPAPTPEAPPSPSPSPSVTTTPEASAATGRVTILAVHALSTRGEATLVVHVGGPGKLRLSGPAIRTATATADVAGNYRFAVIAKAGGAAARSLSRKGVATVGAWVRFTSPVGVRQASRLVRLIAPRPEVTLPRR